jgi:hypothetical protein
MRADIEPGAHGGAVAMQDQRFGVAVEHGFGFDEAAVLDLLQARQRRDAIAIVV